MADERQNEPSLLDTLLLLSPEEVLRAVPLDIRQKVLPLLAGLELLEVDKELSQEEHDHILEVMKKDAIAINQMLNLILSYLQARQAMQNPDNQNSQ